MTSCPRLDALLCVDSLKVWFPIKQGFHFWNTRPKQWLKAVDGLSLWLNKGEVLGVVGESGCGKSTLARALTALEKIHSGHIYIERQEVSASNAATLRLLRSRVQMIFQDPYASLNPRMSVFETIAEPLHVHRKLGGSQLADEVTALMDRVGLAPSYVRKYPHEFSGGQRQRIAIARALALQPQLLIADEPVSALDVSIQAQIINLFTKLQRESSLAMLFISHDLSVVKHVAQRIAVMYLGRIVEIGSAEALFKEPRHPYTQALLSAIPLPVPVEKQEQPTTATQGEPPSPIDPPPGCPFHPRCPIAVPACAVRRPELMDCASDHAVACPVVLEEQGAHSDPDQQND